MTREFDLERQEGVYSAKMVREVRGQIMEWWKPILCEEFVKVVVGMNGGNKINITISDEAIEGGVEVMVKKEGYYRWSWEFIRKSHRSSNSYGMYRGVEDILMGIYPSEWERGEEGKAAVFMHENGLEKEHFLWIKIIINT